MKVGEEQYGLLCEQFNVMRDYRDTLAVRLSLLRRANAKAIDYLGPALAHHYEVNDHHPQHFENGIDGMITDNDISTNF